MSHATWAAATEHPDRADAMSRRRVLQAGAAAAAVSALGVGIGTVAPAAAAPAINPFRVAVPQAALDDLKRRLDGARWPERETEEGWAQGVPLDRLQRLVGYWRTGLARKGSRPWIQRPRHLRRARRRHQLPVRRGTQCAAEKRPQVDRQRIGRLPLNCTHPAR
jgi:Epoxide hydrolase N terminus